MSVTAIDDRLRSEGVGSTRESVKLSPALMRLGDETSLPLALLLLALLSPAAPPGRPLSCDKHRVATMSNTAHTRNLIPNPQQAPAVGITALF